MDFNRRLRAWQSSIGLAAPSAWRLPGGDAVRGRLAGIDWHQVLHTAWRATSDAAGLAWYTAPRSPPR